MFLPKMAHCLLRSLAIVGVSCSLLAAVHSRDPIIVTSSFRGLKTLLPRLSWLVTSNADPSLINAVTFLIDDRIRWVERNGPYAYTSEENFWSRPSVCLANIRLPPKSPPRMDGPSSTA